MELLVHFPNKSCEYICQPSKSSQTLVSHSVDMLLSNLSLPRSQGHFCICRITQRSKLISNKIFQMETNKFHMGCEFNAEAILIHV